MASFVTIEADVTGQFLIVGYGSQKHHIRFSSRKLKLKAGKTSEILNITDGFEPIRYNIASIGRRLTILDDDNNTILYVCEFADSEQFQANPTTNVPSPSAKYSNLHANQDRVGVTTVRDRQDCKRPLSTFCSNSNVGSTRVVRTLLSESPALAY